MGGTESTFHRAAEVVERKTPEELIREARRELGIDAANCFNFGFAGNTGTGKSSLINAIRGLDDDDQYSAKVDEVECTSVIKKYPHPTNPQMVLWDIPGGGTLSNTAATYFMDKKLYAFDTIVIIGAAGFTELDIEIAKAAKLFKVPFLFVRSKSDIDIGSRSHRLKKPRNEVKLDVKEDIVTNMRGQLPVDIKDTTIFVMSSRVFGGANMGFESTHYALDEAVFLEYISAIAATRI